MGFGLEDFGLKGFELNGFGLKGLGIKDFGLKRFGLKRFELKRFGKGLLENVDLCLFLLNHDLLVTFLGMLPGK